MDKLKELKAQAYDLLAQREFITMKLQEVNAEIQRESREEKSV
jgi:hypothetical protein